VENLPEGGASFQVLIPASVAAEAGPGDEVVSNAAKTMVKTIMLVDDEEYVLDMTKRRLNTLGYKSILAQGGKEAVEIFKSRPDQIDLVVLDWAMPDMNGEEVLAQIRKTRPEVPVVVCSGYNQEELGQRFKGLGISGFLRKPFRAAELKQCLKNALELA
jgi:two-component system cell cycle sensor histidine kinase/response regulator CckA